MKKGGHQTQHGFSLLGIILVTVILLGAAGAGYVALKKNRGSAGSPAEKALQTALASATCNYDDPDLCKFFTIWGDNPAYTMTIISRQDGSESRTLVQTDGPAKAHFTVQGDTPYETIMLDDILYTKSIKGIWWRQTLPNDAQEKLKDTPANLEPPTTDTASLARTDYKKSGKEPCGKLTCFKYQIITTAAPEDYKDLIWFDDKSYRLRRALNQTANSSSDATFDYGNVLITAPEGAKELGPNQYLIPGQEEPATLPAQQ